MVANNLTNLTDQCDIVQDMTPLKTLYVILMSLILTLSIVGNTIVLLSVIISPTLKSRQTFYFAASLACSDMIMAIFTISIRIPVVIHNKTFCFSMAVCFVRMIMDSFGNVASILNLLFISIDRYIAINMPYRYVVLLSHFRCKIILISIWTFAFFWSLSGMFSWASSAMSIFAIEIEEMCHSTNDTFFKISFFGIFFPVFVVITCCYVRILGVAITQIQKIQRTTTATKTRKSSAARRGSLLLKELRATKSIAIVYLAFCICWFPACVIMFIKEFNVGILVDIMRDNPVRWEAIWYIFIDIFPAIITAINPVIYSFSNAHFRKGVRYMWRKYRAKSQITDGYYTTTRASCISTTVLHPRDTRNSSMFASNSMLTIVHETPEHSPVAMWRQSKNSIANL